MVGYDKGWISGGRYPAELQSLQASGVYRG